MIINTDNKSKYTAETCEHPANLSTEQSQNQIEIVSINILGYNQKITCQKGEAELFLKAGKMVEDSIQNLRKNIPNFSNERLAILAALDICHELLLKELQLEEFSHIVKTRSAKLKDLLNQIEGAY